jgi:tetratricopeptide (TPR) repeat protein
MASSTILDFENHLASARRYEESAQWEFMARELQEAKSLSETDGFPSAAHRRREVLYQLGSVERRLGRYTIAQQLLEEVLRDPHTSDALRMKVSGELSVVYRHLNNYVEARNICNEQYEAARRLALTAEEVMCRAVGNLGMANYQLSQERQDKQLLQTAIAQILERVERARALQRRLEREDPTSISIRKARTWESIGLDRLTLCYAADGNTAEAVRYGHMSTQMTKDSPDPTIRAMSRFFCAYALLRHGERDKAMELFSYSSPDNPCTCAIALCKEPSDEYCGYLKVMVEEGVDLGGYDEQGYSALDYAVFAGDEQMQEVVIAGLRRDPSLDAASISELLDGARLKKHYKEIFQEYLRPELSRGGDSIQRMRVAYSRLLADDPDKKQLFDELKFVHYPDFVKHGRLPRSTDDLTQTYAEASLAHAQGTFDPYVVFISYRWIGTAAPASPNSAAAPPNPDDAGRTQYRRMLDTLRDLLEDTGIDPERLYIWLVSWEAHRIIGDSLTWGTL